MALNRALIRISCPAATGNYSDSSLSFTPQLVKFFSNSGTATGVRVDFEVAQGAMDSYGNQFSISATANDDRATTSETYRVITNDKCISVLNPNNGAILASAEYVSMNSDGFTINFTTVTSGIYIYALCIEGADDIRVGTEAQGSGTGIESYTVATDHTPHALEIFSGKRSGLGEAVVVEDACFNYGFTDGTTQSCISVRSEHNQATSLTGRSSNSARILQSINATMDGHEDRATFYSFDANGFSLNWTVVESSARYFHYISYQGLNAKVSEIDGETSTGTAATTGVGFTPEALFFAGIGKSTHDVFSNNFLDLGWALGAGTADQVALFNYDENSKATTNTFSYIDESAIITRTDSTAGTVSAEADVDSFDSDGFTLDYTVAPISAIKHIYLALAQSHMFEADDIVSGTPEVNDAPFSENNGFEPTGIATGNPVVNDSTLTPGNVLLADNIIPIPEVNDATITQHQLLESDSFATGNPVVNDSTLTPGDPLEANNFETEAPSLTDSSITQVHNVLFDDINPIPEVGDATITQHQYLTSDNLEGGIPEVNDAPLSEKNHFDPVDIVTGTPELQNSLLKQNHNLFYENIATEIPVVNESLIKQQHNFDPIDIITGSPDVNDATITGIENLEADSFISQKPVVNDASLTPGHVLAADSFESGIPELGSPDYDETFSFDVESIVTGNPVVNDSSITQNHNINVDIIETGNPVVNDSSITQHQYLISLDLVSGNPIVDAITFILGIVFLADSFESGIPVVSDTSLTTNNSFNVENITSGTPEVNDSTITQNQLFRSWHVTTKRPYVSDSTLNQEHVLIIPDIATGIPNVDDAPFRQRHIILYDNIVAGIPVVNDSSISGNHSLIGDDVINIPVVNDSNITQNHNLDGDDVINIPVVNDSNITQHQYLTSDNLEGGIPELELAVFANWIELTAGNLESGIPVFETPEIFQLHGLAVENIITGNPELGSPSLTDIFSRTPWKRIIQVTAESRTINIVETRIIYEPEASRIIDI